MLKYNPEQHIYTYNGIEVPSVNQILKAEGIIPSFDFPNAQFYRDRGTAVHELIKLHFYGELLFIGDLEDYYNGFLKFLNDNPVNPTEVEKPLFSKKWRFAGTPDMWEGDILYDWKVSKKDYPHYELTMGAYAILLEEMGYKVEKALLVHIQPNDYFITEIKPDKNNFLAILLTYQWKRRHLCQ